MDNSDKYFGISKVDYQCTYKSECLWCHFDGTGCAKLETIFTRCRWVLNYQYEDDRSNCHWVIGLRLLKWYCQCIPSHYQVIQHLKIGATAWVLPLPSPSGSSSTVNNVGVATNIPMPTSISIENSDFEGCTSGRNGNFHDLAVSSQSGIVLFQLMAKNLPSVVLQVGKQV